MSVTIYHNPSCGTSRNTLAMIRQSGEAPEVIEYLKTPPSRARLIELIAAMGISVRALLREKGTPYAELGLADPKWSDDELIDFMLALPGNEQVRSINPIVAETNDGTLNDIRSRPVGRDEVSQAIKSAAGGAVEEGSVGAGTGTIAFGFKGGIGTSSRKLAKYTVGVLVQTNFGGSLTIAGVPVGRELASVIPSRADSEEPPWQSPRGSLASLGMTQPTGSCVIVIATDAPVDARNLKRMAARAIMGLARTGAAGSNGSGDYAIAFSTARGEPLLSNDEMSPLFLATIEATEEAIINSLLRATTVTGNGHTAEALPIDKTMEILRRHGVIH